MSSLNWESEKQRFMAVAYEPGLRAAKRAFSAWHPSKREDAQAEFMAKLVRSVVAAVGAWQRPRAAALSLAALGEEVGPVRPQDYQGAPVNIDIQDYRSRNKPAPHGRAGQAPTARPIVTDQ